MFGKRKVNVNAIMDDQVEELLRKTSQYDDLFKQKLRCDSCNTIITLDNIGIMIPFTENERTILKFYCEKISCMEEYKNNG